MEVQGKIKLINKTETFGKNNFAKREIVVITEEQYPQHISIEFVQDKCDLLDKFKIGQDVIIGINLRGREWTNPQGDVKHFNSIQGWKISKANDTETAMAQATAMVDKVFAPADDLNTVKDDLPF